MYAHKIFLALALACMLSSEIVSAATDKVVCYLGSWAHYRLGNGKFEVEDIDPFLCTHVIYTFLNINPDGTVQIWDTGLEIDQGALSRFTGLKKKNPNLKTLIAIGGWSAESLPFSKVAVDAAKRANLINSAVTLLKTYGFDGFDLDWEYPAQRGGAAVDKANFAALIKEFRAEFDKHGYILTAAVAAVPASVDQSYDVPALSKYLDIINVMAYDLHGSWDGVTGQNAPLYASSFDSTDYEKTLNVDASIRGWISRGADPQKLALGVGSYGRTYTTASATSNTLGSVAWNGGQGGPYTQSEGMLGYNEICEKQLQGGWTTVWDDQQKVPYMYKGNQWVGFDNPKSIAIKAQYALSLNLGGVMMWSVETEDFRGICGPKYPLLNAIKTVLGGTTNENLPPAQPEEPAQPPQEDEPAQPEKPEEPAQQQPEEPAQGGNDADVAPPPANGGGSSSSDSLCKTVGYVVDPVDCNVFYYCLQNGDTLIPLKQNCPAGLAWDGNTCNYRDLVKC